MPSFCFRALRLAARVVPDIVGRKQRNYRDGLLSIASSSIAVAQEPSDVHATVSRNVKGLKIKDESMGLWLMQVVLGNI